MMIKLIRLLLRVFNGPTAIRRKLRRRIILSEMQSVGRNFIFEPLDTYVVQYLSVGDDVFIAGGAYVISCEQGPIRLCNKVMIGPNLMILTGDHDFNLIGKHTRDVTEPGRHAEVVLEEDVWCGANVTILKGARIGEGCVVGAGSVVTKNLPPYTICAGNPCRWRKKRFSDSELITHLKLLGRSDSEAMKVVALRTQMTET